MIKNTALRFLYSNRNNKTYSKTKGFTCEQSNLIIEMENYMVPVCGITERNESFLMEKYMGIAFNLTIMA